MSEDIDESEWAYISGDKPEEPGDIQTARRGICRYCATEMETPQFGGRLKCPECGATFGSSGVGVSHWEPDEKTTPLVGRANEAVGETPRDGEEAQE